MRRFTSVIISAIAVLAILDGGCGGDDNLTGQPQVKNPNVGRTESFLLNTCRESNGVLVYEGCSQARADAACQEFGYEKAISYQCSRDTCGLVDTTFVARVICWKP